jgi:threonine/homoserine/homoserine lactone efflux protein
MSGQVIACWFRTEIKMFSLEFLTTSLVVVLIPGTGVIYTVSTGLFLGWRQSIAAALGCTAGILPHLCACVLGLSAILHMSALAFQVLKYAGTLYLLYMAWSMWRETGQLQLNRQIRGKSDGFSVALRGFLINILNPKLSIFFLAFLPLFVPSGADSPLGYLLMLSGVFMAMTLVIFILYGLLAGGVSTHLIRSATMVRRLQRFFAGIFALLAVKLAISEQ